MSDANQDKSVLQAVLDRLNNHRLPRLLDLKDKVDRGGLVLRSSYPGSGPLLYKSFPGSTAFPNVNLRSTR
jgi:hypothetical protein